MPLLRFPSLLLRLLRLTLRFQLGLRQLFEQRVFAPPERLHIPQDRGHVLVGFTVRGHSGQDIEHITRQPVYRRAILRGQRGQNLIDRRIHIKRDTFCLVGVGLIKPIDPAGKLAIFIVGQAGFFQYVEVFPTVDQFMDALLYLVPIQLDGSVNAI